MRDPRRASPQKRQPVCNESPDLPTDRAAVEAPDVHSDRSEVATQNGMCRHGRAVLLEALRRTDWAAVSPLWGRRAGPTAFHVRPSFFGPKAAAPRPLRDGARMNDQQSIPKASPARCVDALLPRPEASTPVLCWNIGEVQAEDSASIQIRSPELELRCPKRLLSGSMHWGIVGIIHAP
jgi:hypothetical protein